ncbi:Hypothetical protein R9X50_00792500 [Acrodontium crateriforme]|uniref:Phosphoglycerate mutase-like protein n=1 Tax=Acrodontium crateriforme TaxID=150365 RepID=A0AAQ3ME91_9PEZI|nr:Hypothetical protein R9X50_00792500 [Acrodontium crateriforme]
MKLFLIRHGETVDNVAGLYAGIRDSALTNHGADQARRLGEYLAKNDVKLTHIFCSTLSRAYKTADSVYQAQSGLKEMRGDQEAAQGVVRLPELIEQDFGFYEGKPFYSRTEAQKTGKQGHYDKHKDDPGFIDIESKASMAKRADDFLDNHLLPLLVHENTDDGLSIAVVSHGILLSNLWRRLLLRLPKKSLTIAPEVTASRGTLVLEHLGGWSNTGYLELTLRKQGSLDKSTLSTVASTDNIQEAATEEKMSPSGLKLGVKSAGRLPETSTAPMLLCRWTTTIDAVDSVRHLAGLKRQRGGIGRSAFDETQKKLDCFFKRQKRD